MPWPSPNCRMIRVARGEILFSRCASCHGSMGEGRPGSYPPLRGSGYVQGEPARLVRILLRGIEGPLDVGGHTYNQRMPSWRHLSDEDLAAIASWLRQAWGEPQSVVTPEDVAAERERAAEAGPLMQVDLGGEFE